MTVFVKKKLGREFLGRMRMLDLTILTIKGLAQALVLYS